MTEYPNVDTWTRINPEEAYASSDGKNFILNIEKIVPSISRMTEEEKESILFLKTFLIERKLFYTKTDMICQYIDYFIEFFDPDKELPLAYLSIKETIDSDSTITTAELLKLMAYKFFHDTSIKKNIYRMVEANYNIDVTVDAKTGRVFDNPMDITNEDAKALLAVSIYMKFIVPIMSQYVNTTTLYTDSELSEFVTDVFVDCFYKMGNSNYLKVDVDVLIVKLYDFTEKKIRKHHGLHKLLWNQQCALRGLTEDMHIDTILIKHLISNNMFKFKFDNNIVSFMKSIVETQLMCTIQKLKYKADPVRIDNDKNYNGLSGIDKLEQSKSKLDESSVIRSAKSISYEFDMLEKLRGTISQEEHDYYVKNLESLDKFHEMIVDYFYARDFDGFTELKNIGPEKKIDLMILAKRRLKEEGYDELYHLLSSKSVGRMSNRLLQNAKYISKYNTTEIIQKLSTETYRTLEGSPYKDAVLDMISKVLNNAYLYVEYDDQEKTGQPIEFNEDHISADIIRFIDTII